MKTLTANRKLRLYTICVLILTSFVFLTSCQKDEVLPINGTTVNTAAIDRVGSNSNIALTSTSDKIALLRVEHQPARADIPNYTFTLYSNGLLVYEGIRNVKAIGTYNFSISNEKITEYYKLFQTVDFFKIVDKNFYVPDIPLNVVTCANVLFQNGQQVPTHETRTLYERNNDPSHLVGFRTRAEALLGINRLTVGENVGISTSESDIQ